MSTEISPSDHTSTTHEQAEEKKDEGIGEKSVSLSSDSEDKPDKGEDSKGTETPLAMAVEASVEDKLNTEEDKKHDATLIEEEKNDNSPMLEASDADDLKKEVVKADAIIDDSPSLEASIADNFKAEKQMITEPPSISVNQSPIEASSSSPSSPTEKEESIETAKEDNLKTLEDNKLDAAVVKEERIDDSLLSEGSTADNLKEEKQLIHESSTISIDETPPPMEDESVKTKEDDLKTEEDKKTDAALAEEEKNDDSPVSINKTPSEPPPPEEESTKTREENLKTEEDAKLDAALVEEEKIDNSSPLEASIADVLKEEEESTETREERQPHTLDIPSTVNPQMESEIEAVKETENSEVQEKSQEPEKTSQQKGQEEQRDIQTTPKSLAETIEKPSVAILETREPEPVVAAEVEENPSETEKLSFEKGEEEQQEAVVPATSVESTEKQSDTVEVHPPKHSDIVSAEEEKKPIENLEVAEKGKEQTSDVEAKQQHVDQIANTNSEGTSDNIKDSIPLKKEEETSVTGSTAQVSLNKEAQVEAEPSPEIVEKIVDVIEGVSDNQEGDKIDQSVEEKVAATANDVAEGLSRGAEDEPGKLESVKDDQAEDVNEKEKQAETKIDEIAPAASAPVRETLASKLEEKEEESSITSTVDKLESDATKTSKESAAAKTPQKQSNNILSKVKQSLVKAKKALTGKSPTGKTLSSDTKADIQVK